MPQEEVPLYESKGKQFMKKPAIPVGMCPLVAQEAKLKRERQQAKQANPIPGLIVLPNQTKKPSSAVKNQTEAGASSAKKPSTKSKVKKANVAAPETTHPSSSADSNALSSAMENLTVTSDEDLAKKLKKLRKKIREIETIEAKLASGELKKPEQDQLDKITRKHQILDELKTLEELEAAQ